MNAVSNPRPMTRVVIRRRAADACATGESEAMPSRRFGPALAFVIAVVGFGKLSKPAQMIGFSVDQLSLVQDALMLLALCYLSIAGSARMRVAALLMPAAALAGTLLSSHPAAAFLRWAGWVSVYALGTPLFAGERARIFRVALWKGFIQLAIAIALVSFPLYFVRLLPGGQGFFSGIMVHSMILAPIAGLASIACLARYLNLSSRKWLALFLLSTAVLALSGSRGTLLATLCGCLPIAMSAGARTRTRLLLVLALVGSAGAAVIVFRGDLKETEIGDYYTNKGFRNTRADPWAKGLSDVREHFWLGTGIGLGSGIGDTDSNQVREIKNIGIGSQDMHIETGSSWIAMLSMTGIAGTMGFMALIIPILLRARREIRAPKGVARQELFACLVFFFVHASFEGYIFAVGDPLALVFWLCWGRLDDLHQKVDGAPARKPDFAQCPH